METVGMLVGSVMSQFGRLWYGEKDKKEIEGYFMSSKDSRTLLLVRKNDTFWKTEWFDDAEYNYKSPTMNINYIFTPLKNK